MISSDYRREAREKLTGKWGKAALIMLCFFAYTLILSYIDKHTTGFYNFTISVFSLVINIPLAYGLTMSYLKLYNDEEIGYFDFFTLGFENFSRAWSVAWHVFLKVLVPFILVVVSYVLITIGMVSNLFNYARNGLLYSFTSFGVLSIIGIVLLIASSIWLALESFYYELSQYIAIENQNMTGKEVAVESKRLMTNKRWKLFCLQFSFIGWAILAVLSFGIGMLWLAPYMLFATVAFYKNTIGNKETVVNEPVQEVVENTEK